jgi:hypothetical protein
VGGKRLLQVIFSGVEGKISHKQFRAHLMIYLFCLPFSSAANYRVQIIIERSSLKILHGRKVNCSYRLRYHSYFAGFDKTNFDHAKARREQSSRLQRNFKPQIPKIARPSCLKLGA